VSIWREWIREVELSDEDASLEAQGELDLVHQPEPETRRLSTG
ncbi:MAG: AI-2E family transporter, partial [Allorhizobium sp.]